jgi:hypothetical protein
MIRIARMTKTSGAGGFPSRWTVWTVEVNGIPLVRKDGRVRTWATRKAAARVAQAQRGEA